MTSKKPKAVGKGAKKTASVPAPKKNKPKAAKPKGRSTSPPKVMHPTTPRRQTAGVKLPPQPSDVAPEKIAPPKSVKPSFKVGELVVYPFHGVGVVKAVEKINVIGETKLYYTLDFRNGELTVKIPVEQQEEKGIRKIVGKADVETIISILKKKPPAEESDWKVRHNIYLEKLKSGDIYEAAKVARNLSKRGPEGELSMSEKRLLEASVQLLVHEIAHASRQPVEKVEAEISKHLRAGR